MATNGRRRSDELNDGIEHSRVRTPSRVSTAAFLLMVVAALGLVSNWMSVLAFHDFRRDQGPPQRPPGMKDDEWEAAQLGAEAAPILDLFLISIPTVAVYGLVMWGGRAMQRGRNRSLAITAACVAMLPCSPALLIGLPIGIWALIVLFNPDVIEHFERRARRLNPPPLPRRRLNRRPMDYDD